MGRVVRGIVVAVALAVAVGRQVEAGSGPVRTVVDGVVPPVAGLRIVGDLGGCDLLVENSTGQEVVLFDQSTPPQPLRVAALAASAPKIPVPVHLTGKWPCAAVPRISEDHSWNHVPVTLLTWSLGGQAGRAAFQVRGRSVYDPELDPTAQWMLGLRIAAGVGVVGGVIIAVPYLLSRRRQILNGAP